MKTLANKGVMIQLQFEFDFVDESIQDKIKSKVQIRTADSDGSFINKTSLFLEGFEVFWTHFLERANKEWTSIALKGYPNEMSINLDSQHQLVKSKANVWLVHDEFPPPFAQDAPTRHMMEPMTNLEIKTLSFREKTKIFTLLRQVSIASKASRQDSYLISWQQGNMFCSERNSTLPVILALADLNQIIGLLKYVIHIPPLEGLYIGLQYQVKNGTVLFSSIHCLLQSC